MEGVIEDCACNLVHYLQSAGRTVPREVRILAGIDVPDSP